MRPLLSRSGSFGLLSGVFDFVKMSYLSRFSTDSSIGSNRSERSVSVKIPDYYRLMIRQPTDFNLFLLRNFTDQSARVHLLLATFVPKTQYRLLFMRYVRRASDKIDPFFSECF
jgi:hypothetical protein